MNEEIMKALGFDEELDLIHQGKCPFCKKDITAKELASYPKINRKEFEISKICKECQDEFFDKE